MQEEQEPKYDCNMQGQIFNRTTGKFIPDEEPIFILRAKDKNAALLLAHYKKLCFHETHKNAINNRLHDFVAFANEYPERMKEPDTFGT